MVNSMTDDGQLLRQYLETQSEAAFAELVKRHLNLVYFAALRRLGGDAHAAADVAQEVFIILARKAWKLCGHPSLTGWLYSTVNYQVSALVRTGRRRQIREQKFQTLQEVSSTTESLANEETLRPVLDEAILQLNQDDREALLLRYFEGCPFAELGSKLGLSEAAAQKRVERAQEKLRKLLGQQGFTSASAALAATMASESLLAAPNGLTATIASTAAASIGPTSSLTLAFIQIMSTTKLTLGAIGLLALAALLGTTAVGVAALQFHEAERQKEMLVNGRAEFAADQARLHQLHQEANNAEKGVLNLKKAVARASSRLAQVSRSASGRPRPSGTPRQMAQEFFAAFPEARALLLQVGKAQIQVNYGPFFKSSALSPAQIAQFIDATSQVWSENVNLTATSVTPAVRLPPEDVLRSILGDQGYQQLQDYTQIMPVYWVVRTAALDANLASVPLSSPQQDQLVQILARNSTPNQMTGPVTPPEVNWEAVLAQAQPVVSAVQWPAVQAALLQNQFQLAYATAAMGHGPTTQTSGAQ